MSHVKVGVITYSGTDAEVEKLMAPYHNFSATGIDDEYVQTIDITEKVNEDYRLFKHLYTDLLDAARDHTTCPDVLTCESQIDLTKAHKYGYIMQKPGEALRVYDRENPNAFWDWWVIGGRWDDCYPDNRVKAAELLALPISNRDLFWEIVAPHGRCREVSYQPVSYYSDEWRTKQEEVLKQYADAYLVIVDVHL